MTISAERRIGVNLRILAPTVEDQNLIVENIYQDFLTVVNHYIDETTDENHAIILIGDATCSNCGKLVAHCQCGRAHSRPLV